MKKTVQTLDAQERGLFAEPPKTELEALRAEVARLRALINTPHVEDFLEAVRLEAAHQCERWGVENDAGKRNEDWSALISYLHGKAVKAHFDRDGAKLVHHVITVAAVCLNWHAHIHGHRTRMRPGVAPTEGA